MAKPEAIKVRINSEVREHELYCRLRITRGPDKDKTTRKLYDLEKFIVNDAGYTILTVAEDEVKVMNEQGNVITLEKK